jgi:hypothetical protein
VVSIGYGDWLEGEVRLSERGQVVHEVEFSNGARWIIECAEIRHSWKPTDQ